VNSLYTLSAAPAGVGWSFTSPDGAITKTITLADGSDKLVGAYALAGGYSKLFVRFGLAPDLDDLLVHGQAGLSISSSPAAVAVSNAAAHGVASARVGLENSVTWQSVATDDDLSSYDSVNMRNQAQVQQIEVESQSTNFTVSLALTNQITDADVDGLPTAWEIANGLDDGDANGGNGADGDPDGDGLTNIVEWLVGLNPNVVDNVSFPKLAIAKTPAGFHLAFPTLPGRKYQIQESVTLGQWAAFGSPLVTEPETVPGLFEMDDNSSLPKRFYRVIITPAP
jgi:hypothetical protein